MTAIAYAFDAPGVNDADLLARSFVALCALLHLASALVLFRILERRVSLGTAIAAAGGVLFSMSLVWTRVDHYDARFRPAPSMRGAVVLGVPLGFTALARLNAGLLIPVLLAFFLFDRWAGAIGSGTRFKLALVTAAAAAIVAPYFIYNLVTTGHPLPVSGAAKAVYAKQFLHRIGASGRLTLTLFKALVKLGCESVTWFITSRSLDATWAIGGRVLFDGGLGAKAWLGVTSAIALLPVVAGPRAWARQLRERFSLLRPFAFVGVFAAVNAVVSMVTYPTQVNYALVR